MRTPDARELSPWLWTLVRPAPADFNGGWLMKAELKDRFDYVRELATQTRQRVLVGPAAGNAAALIAMAHIATSVESPDYAFAALRLPMSLFAVGLIVGTLAVHFENRLLGLQMRLLRVLQSLSILNADLDALESTIEELDAYEIDDDEVKASLKAQKARVAANRARQSKTRQSAEDMADDPVFSRAAMAADSLSAAAAVVLAAGLGALLIGHATGAIRLEPPGATPAAEPAPPSPSPAPLLPAGGHSGSPTGSVGPQSMVGGSARPTH